MGVGRIGSVESALGDLARIHAWYAAEGVPEVRDRLVAEIFQRVEVLATTRTSGGSFRSLPNPSCAS
jgi:toxin ParE1/3/4